MIKSNKTYVGIITIRNREILLKVEGEVTGDGPVEELDDDRSIFCYRGRERDMPAGRDPIY
jgi:hypothetical protein